ncbi:hypothetical protein SAMN05421823_106181 [Catalinimonas alkaloidigena]|uniref:Uncharacterized protein n=1 Tax=Catalinimonas alkaloidigena TaxID=1075417 RepID=A0A1G9KKE1_9BACT|nr:GNAT family N-acetyltransferase [Catalinimonas alkaloidigena]SDL49873.1 hypothetical protein SAMN05421823_106181 [Catalinimonas alkaloidigena]
MSKLFIQHQDDGPKGSFYYAVDGVPKAQMFYVWAGNQKLIIDHTEVDPSLRGQGVGEALLEQIVAYARTKGVKILPLCPFANAQFKKHPEYQDVL